MEGIIDKSKQSHEMDGVLDKQSHETEGVIDKRMLVLARWFMLISTCRFIVQPFSFIIENVPLYYLA